MHLGYNSFSASRLGFCLMLSIESVHAARSNWLASQSIFSVLDPDFGQSESLLALLGRPLENDFKPTARLRYFALSEQTFVAIPGKGSQAAQAAHWAPGLHYINLPEYNAELHLWIGPSKAGLQEFQGQFDAVLHPQAKQFYGRRLNSERIATNRPASVAVIGAGIAGSSVALALCEQGVKVHLFDSASGPAAGASGNWVGAFHPHITRGDSPLSKLSRLGFEHTADALELLSRRGLLQKGEDWAMPGHLQTVPENEAERMRKTLVQLNFPLHLVRWAAPNELLPTPLGGLYFPNGGWVKPARWVQANLQACGSLLSTHYNSAVNSIRELRQQHDAVVVCCAEQSIELAPIEGARVNAVKGQISKLHSVKQPGVVLSGESYAIAPPAERWMVLGATYERPVLDLNPTMQADQENTARFEAAFPDWPLGELLDHRCAVRSVWHDRLPAIGPVPEMPGVFMSTGFASRGLLWAALGGWIVAGHCMCQPFESKLLGKIKPRGAP